MTTSHVYITARVSDLPEDLKAPASVRGSCSRCHVEVWIDPMTYVPAASRHDQRRLRVLCGPCAASEGLLG